MKPTFLLAAIMILASGCMWQFTNLYHLSAAVSILAGISVLRWVCANIDGDDADFF